MRCLIAGLAVSSEQLRSPGPHCDGTGLGRFTVIMTDCMAEDTDGITEQRSTISNIGRRG